MSTLPTSMDALRTGLAQTHQRMRVSAGGEGEMYLKLMKSGIWVYGPDDMDVQDGALWAVDPNSFMVGYISWEQDETKPASKLGEMMVPATDPPVDITKLPDTGCKWDEQMQITMLCLTGEDSGMRVIYNSTSKGGLRAINGVLGSIIDRLGNPEFGDSIIPVVELLTDSYNHKRYGKIYTPILDIKRWESMASTPAAAAETETAPEEAAPETEAAPEAEKPKPQRQRRRRAAA